MSTLNRRDYVRMLKFKPIKLMVDQGPAEKLWTFLETLPGMSSVMLLKVLSTPTDFGIPDEDAKLAIQDMLQRVGPTITLEDWYEQKEKSAVKLVDLGTKDPELAWKVAKNLHSPPKSTRPPKRAASDAADAKIHVMSTTGEAEERAEKRRKDAETKQKKQHYDNQKKAKEKKALEKALEKKAELSLPGEAMDTTDGSSPLRTPQWVRSNKPKNAGPGGSGVVSKSLGHNLNKFAVPGEEQSTSRSLGRLMWKARQSPSHIQSLSKKPKL